VHRVNKMSSKNGASLFIGRLSRHTRVKDLEEIFEAYGRITRCDIKYGELRSIGKQDVLHYFTSYDVVSVITN